MTHPHFKGSDDIPEEEFHHSYNQACEKIKDLRTETYKVFFQQYTQRYPEATIQTIMSMLIQEGINVYNKEMETSCKTTDDVYESVIQYYPTQSKADIQNVMMDHGLGVISEKEFGCSNAFRFLDRYGEKKDE